jgi:hypothetical protein
VRKVTATAKFHLHASGGGKIVSSINPALERCAGETS